MMRRVAIGFTLVELVIVIAIVGILAAIAVPRFIDLRLQAYTASRDGIVGSVRAGVMLTASKNQLQAIGVQSADTFPDNLEETWGGLTGGTLGVPPLTCDSTTPCFELVVPGGFIDGNWELTSSTPGAGATDKSEYTFDNPVDSPDVDTVFEYDQAVGTFIQTAP